MKQHKLSVIELVVILFFQHEGLKVKKKQK